MYHRRLNQKILSYFVKNYKIKLLFVLFIILLGVNLYDVFVNKSNSYWGIASNLLMAVSMIIQIRQSKKEKNINTI